MRAARFPNSLLSLESPTTLQKQSFATHFSASDRSQQLVAKASIKFDANLSLGLIRIYLYDVTTISNVLGSCARSTSPLAISHWLVTL